jgi:hypothetical protein
MHRGNGQAKGVAQPVTAGGDDGAKNLFTQEQIGKLIAELEVPFDPKIIEWRVTNTTRDEANRRGQVIPYADQRAYTDRLNTLFTPAGWTRSYAVHASANFERGSDHKTVAKVFVTCHLTIFGIGSHSATGEEWIDDENAGTSAEAQAFKRACSCFGLGRYFYYFNGVWVDLDERKRPTRRPVLTGWATPEGWRNGLRPEHPEAVQERKTEGDQAASGREEANNTADAEARQRDRLAQEIEALEQCLGRGLYRGLLKSVAHAWNPRQVRDQGLLQKVLSHMRGAQRGLRRLQTALEQSAPGTLEEALRSVNLRSLHEVRSLETLHKIVLTAQAQRKV